MIGETLERATRPPETTAEFVARLAASIDSPTEYGPGDYELFAADPLTRWVESTIGLAEVDGRLVRAEPRTLGGAEGIAAELAQATGAAPADAAAALRTALIAGSRVLDSATGRTLFAFKLHQFVSRGSSATQPSRPKKSGSLR